MGSFESWASIIRSCCLTSKTPLTPWEINRDTKLLEGRDIPFIQFGCSTLEEMLRKINGLTVFLQQGKTVVKVTPTKETAHISRMVGLQKPAKQKSRKRRSGAYNKFSANARRPPSDRSQENNQNVSQYNNALNQRATPKQVEKAVIGPTPVTPSYRPPASKLKMSRTSSLSSYRPPATSPATQPSQSPSLMATSLDDPRLTLNKYAEARKLPLPVYKYLPMKNHTFISSVDINSKKYSSYPKETETKEEAQKLAAQAALDDLSCENWTPITTTSDKNLVVKRVEKTVHSRLVESYNITQYNERLPQDYLKHMESPTTSDIQANQLTRLSPQIANDNGTISRSMCTEPEVLKLDDMEYFWLYVCVVYNTTAIWGVLTDKDYNDEIKELTKKMKAFYDNNNTKRPLVIPGKFYAVFDQEWHRVRCVKTGKQGRTATVFFIDRGEEDVFWVSELYVLPSEFCRLPAQAVLLSMAGLEIYADRTEVQPRLKEILNGKYVIVKNLKYSQRSTLTNVISAQIYYGKDNRWYNANEQLRLEILANDDQDQDLCINSDSIFTFIRNNFDLFWPLLFLPILDHILCQNFIQ